VREAYSLQTKTDESYDGSFQVIGGEKTLENRHAATSCTISTHLQGEEQCC
jgi:hypothetical protein